MIPPPTHRARGEEARSKLGRAAWTPAPKIHERRALNSRALHHKDRPPATIDLDDVIPLAAVLIEAGRGPPARGERQPTVPTVRFPM